MIEDTNTEFMDAAALNTGAAGTYLIGNVIDLGSARDVGDGEPVFLVITVDTGIQVASGTGTVQFVLASDSAAAISTSTSQRHLVTAAFATSTTPIAAGTVLYAAALPKGLAQAYKRYLGILQITGTTAISAGKINALLTRDAPNFVAMPAAI